MKRGDFIIIGIVILIITGFLLNSLRNQSDELIVEVRVDGKVVDQFNINMNITKVYETKYGVNELQIMNRVVTVIDADCFDQICVDTKDGTRGGDAIVCVPNRFSVELIGGEAEVDAISR